MRINIRNLAFAFVTILLSADAFGQTTQTRYFNNKYLQKETTADKGKFKQTTTENADGTVTTAVVNVRNNELISTYSYKGNEPVGLWLDPPGNKTMDYTFDLVYSDKRCADTIAGITKYFENNDSLAYIAPSPAEGKTIYEAVYRHLRYPAFARENNIQGKVYLTFIITQSGDIKDITVHRGAHVSLDKEAVRVVRMLKLSAPPLLNGKPEEVCVLFPVSFKLE